MSIAGYCLHFSFNMSYFGLNLGQTAEDSDMFTNIWLSSKGLLFCLVRMLSDLLNFTACVLFIFNESLLALSQLVNFAISLVSITPFH